ncbi:hypothetical protein [Yoonia sp. 2307UL14-13]|uniref:hypothetical protein n=1 Tax=Yoonia sp. 2307UL14-13 TaxID=3126506 RepID=UPI0030B289D1
MNMITAIAPHAQVAIASKESANTYKVTQKRGAIMGVGASVSGAGAWVKLSGGMDFEIQSLESSKTYKEMRKSYNISGGVSGFFSWITGQASADTQKSEIQTALKEISQSQKVGGHVDIEMMVTGAVPNMQVDASAYILVLQVEDSQGNTFNIASNGDPAADTGAQDSNGNALPNNDNNSTITL